MISFSNNVGKQNKNSIFQCHTNAKEENETRQIRLLMLKGRKRTTNAKKIQKKKVRRKIWWPISHSRNCEANGYPFPLYLSFPLYFLLLFFKRLLKIVSQTENGTKLSKLFTDTSDIYHVCR